MPDLSTAYLGLPLKNPLVPSASPLSRQGVDALLHLEDAGAAAVVMHSLYEEDVLNDERMMDRFLVHPDALGESRGHLPDASDYVSRLDAYLEQIGRLKARLSIPVIASLNGISPNGWVELGWEMEAAGADALELNTWFLPMDPDCSGETVESRYLAVLEALKVAVRIPITLKLSPFFSSLPHFLKKAEAAGASGAVLFNRFFQPDIDIETLSVVDRAQLSSSADALLTMRWIAMLHGRSGLSLAASGGVHTAADAIKMLLAGADVAHMTSAILLRGPGALAETLRGLEAWMETHEYESVTQMKGSMSQCRQRDPEVFARTAYLHALSSFEPPPGVRY